MTDETRLQKIPDGIAWYYENPNAESSTKHEGLIEIFPGWIRLGGPIATWIPRENVEQIHES
jgi:hypothetical protein